MKPTSGRIVNFVQKKPAAYGDALVHLPTIFTDGTNSDADETNRVKWVTSVTLDETQTPQPRNWHWPERD